jgi:hypothetical protein
MKPSEIITQDVTRRKGDPKAVLASISKMVKGNQAIMMSTEGSVLLVKRLGEGLAELHLFTVESPLALARSLKTFIAKIKQSDIKTVYGEAENPQIIQLLQSVGVKVSDSNLPNYNWKADVWAQ